VQYNRKFPAQVKAFAKEREEYCKKNAIELDLEKKDEVLDYAEFARNQIDEKGLPNGIDVEKASKILGNELEKIAFYHVTEFEDSKDPTYSTAVLVNKLFKGAESLF
jgi:hypothetical protein